MILKSFQSIDYLPSHYKRRLKQGSATLAGKKHPLNIETRIIIASNTNLPLPNQKRHLFSRN